MRLLIFTLLLPLAVFGDDSEPITSTRTITSTVTQTVTVHIIPSAFPPPQANDSMPYDKFHATASAYIPAPSMAAPSQNYVNKNNTNVVDSPIPAPKESTPIMRGNSAGCLSSKNTLLAIAGIVTVVATW